MKKIILILGVLLMIAGGLLLGWFFLENHLSEQKMLAETETFMETITEVPPAKILEGDTTSVLEFPTQENYRVAVKEGTTPYVLSLAAGHMKGTEQPWDPTGTVVVTAHNNTFFRGIAKLEMGAEVLAYTRQGVFRYKVYDRKTIQATDFSVTEDVPGLKTLVMITCDFTGTRRIVVFARGGEKVMEAQDI